MEAKKASGEIDLIDEAVVRLERMVPPGWHVERPSKAGSPALLVAKAHKLHDRIASGRAARIDDKDAADVVRLMQSTSPAEIAATLSVLVEHEVAGAPTRQAIDFIEELFGRRSGRGIEMASRALRTAVPADRVRALCTAFVAELRSGG